MLPPPGAAVQQIIQRPVVIEIPLQVQQPADSLLPGRRRLPPVIAGEDADVMAAAFERFDDLIA